MRLTGIQGWPLIYRIQNKFETFIYLYLCIELNLFVADFLIKRRVVLLDTCTRACAQMNICVFKSIMHDQVNGKWIRRMHEPYAWVNKVLKWNLVLVEIYLDNKAYNCVLAQNICTVMWLDVSVQNMRYSHATCYISILQSVTPTIAIVIV